MHFLPGRHPTKKLAESSHAKETQRGFVAFGSLAILLRRARNLRPMALRPRFSPGLPLSVCYRAMLAKNFTIEPYNQLSRWSLRSKGCMPFAMDRDTNETDNGRKLSRSTGWIMSRLIDQTLRDLRPGTVSKVSQGLDFKISCYVRMAAVSQMCECITSKTSCHSHEVHTCTVPGSVAMLRATSRLCL
jgi:hypothetical protein